MIDKEFNKNDLLFTTQGLTLEEFKEMMEEIYKDFKGDKND